MGKHTSDDVGGFGPFAVMFQNYASAFETLSRGMPPLGSEFPTAFDTHAFTTQAVAPLKSAARAQLELMGLANRRLQACMMVPTTLAQCHSPADVMTMQMEFWRTAFEQYAECGRKVAADWEQSLPFAAPYPGTDVATTDHDYINFSGAGSRANAHSSAKPPRSRRQRQVA